MKTNPSNLPNNQERTSHPPLIELANSDLRHVAGGLNPQPLPPRVEHERA